MGALTIDRDAWNDARRALGDDELPFTPYLLPRVERLAVAERLAGAGWSQTMIASAFGISTTTAHRWLNGDRQPDWTKLAAFGSRPAVRSGSQRSRNPERRRRAAEPEPEAAAPEQVAEPWPEAEALRVGDEPEPEGPWNDPEPDDDEPEGPPQRARAKPGKGRPFGAFSKAVAARAAAAGLPLTPTGTVDWAAMQDARSAPQDAPQAASAAVVPPASPLRPAAPTPATRRPQPAALPAIPGRAVDAEVLASCGHALYVPPAKAAPGAGITCTRCGRAGRVQRLTGRYTLG